MPEIIITLDDIENENRWYSAITRIMAVMLYPNDEKKRHELIVFKYAQYIMKMIDAGRMSKTDIPEDQLVKMVKSLMESPPGTRIIKMAKKQIDPGELVGNTLIDMVGGYDVVNKRKSLSEVCKLYKPHFAKGADNPHVNNTWAKKKCVSHLWAAGIHLGQTDGMNFPPTGPLLLKFISHALAYQEKGLNHLNKKFPLLDSDTSWNIVSADAIFIPANLSHYSAPKEG